MTPVDVELARAKAHVVIHFEKAGCAPVDVAVKRTVSGLVALNLLSLNPLAQQGMDEANYPRQVATNVPLTFGVDFLSGGAWKFPKVVHASLCGSEGVSR